jgi:hypothetical protein
MFRASMARQTVHNDWRTLNALKVLGSGCCSPWLWSRSAKSHGFSPPYNILSFRMHICWKTRNENPATCQEDLHRVHECSCGITGHAISRLILTTPRRCEVGGTYETQDPSHERKVVSLGPLKLPMRLHPSYPEQFPAPLLINSYFTFVLRTQGGSSS